MLYSLILDIHEGGDGIGRSKPSPINFLVKQILSLLELFDSGVIQAPYAVSFAPNGPWFLDIRQ